MLKTPLKNINFERTYEIPSRVCVDERARLLLQKKFGASIMVSQGRRDFQGLPSADSGAKIANSLAQKEGKGLS